MEQALKPNRKQSTNSTELDFRLLFQSIPGALLVVLPDDPVFTMVAASETYARVSGVRREDLLGKGVFEVFPDNPGNAKASGVHNLRASFERVIATGLPDQMPVQRYDVERPAAEGGGFEERHWSARNTPVFGIDGGVQYLLHSVEEVTEKVRAEQRERLVMQELLASKTPFRQFAETSAFGLVIGDLEGGLSYLNPSVRELLGYTEEEIAAGLVRWPEITPSEFAALDLEAVRQLATSGRCDPYEKVYVAKDGRRVPVLVGAYLLEPVQGRTEAAAFVIDLTERKLEERERQRLASVVENAGDFIGISDTGGAPVYVNKAGRELVGALESGEWRDTAVTDFFVAEDRAFVQEVVLPAVIEHGVWRGELRLRHFRTGEAIPVLYDAFRVDDPETGKAINFATVARDIRERKRAEQRDAFLVELDDAVRPLTGADEIVQMAARLLGEHLQVDRCTYCCFEADEETFEATWDYTRPRVASIVGRYRLSQFGSEGARLFRANLPWVVDDIEDDPRVGEARDAYSRIGIRASLAVPLFKAGRLVAGMAMHQQTPRQWRPEEVELFRFVANRCWEGIERAKAQANLRQQWHTFDTALSHTPDFIYTFDLEGRFTYANRALLSLWRKPLEEALGKNFFDLEYPPELAERLQRQIQQVIHTKQPLRDQTPFTGPTGETGHYEYIFVPVLTGEGQVEAVTGSTRDITERNSAEVRVEEDRRRWREILLQAPAAIAVLRGPEHRFEWVNADYVRLVGRPADAIAGKIMLEALPEIESQIYGDLLDGVYRTGEPFTGHESLLRIDRGDGILQDLYVNFAYLPTRDAGGQIDGIFVHAMDVTDMVLARRRIEESERQFRTLAESIPNLAWMANETGHIFWYNQRWYDYTGTTLEEMEGWGWQKVHDPKVLPIVLTEWMGAITTGKPFEMVFPLKSADGEFRPFLTRVQPVEDNNGRVVRWFGTNTDIADQRRTEEELRKMNRELEEFAYVASHDLQEPLRMVNIYTQLILKRLGKEDATLNQFAKFVNQGVTRMELLIRDLLTFSRTVQTEESPTGTADLSASLAEAISVLKNHLDECGASITAQHLPSVRGDAAQISHVFQNLLSNAVKYRKKDVAPEIYITVEQAPEEWIVSVRDNGIGFDPQYGERIFGLFKRLHKDEYPGTGLGLAICRRIVERYGGRIWADSRPGEGATFRFALPRVDGDRNAAAMEN